ncbi:hypothetical protein C0J52_07372 [Blattella germanica]|nr:hypothetical protein C0J52_07372 [Blattella germanica]
MKLQAKNPAEHVTTFDIPVIELPNESDVDDTMCYNAVFGSTSTPSTRMSRTEQLVISDEIFLVKWNVHHEMQCGITCTGTNIGKICLSNKMQSEVVLKTLGATILVNKATISETITCRMRNRNFDNGIQ